MIIKSLDAHLIKIRDPLLENNPRLITKKLSMVLGPKCRGQYPLVRKDEVSGSDRITIGPFAAFTDMKGPD